MGILDAIRNHPAIGGVATGTVIGASSVGIINILRSRRAPTTKKKKTKSTTKKTYSRKTKRKTSTSAKRGRTPSSRKVNTKKIYTTKTGQPYIKKANGQARFISKKSAELRRKRKGGYY